MNTFSFKIGQLFGSAASWFIVLYSTYNAYFNIKNHESIAADLALLFVYFIWRKVCKMSMQLDDISLFLAYKELNESEEL